MQDIDNFKRFFSLILFIVLLLTGLTQSSCNDSNGIAEHRAKVYEVRILESQDDMPERTRVYLFNEVWVDGNCLHCVNGNDNLMFCNMKIFVRELKD